MPSAPNIVAACAADIVAVAEFQLQSLRRLGLPANKGRVIPCGAPVEEFSRHPLPQRSGNTIRFITVGRLDPEKGVLETVEAFARVNREYQDSELVVVGTGELRQPAAVLADELGIANRVRFTGQMTPEQIAEELASAHVFLQHSRSHLGSSEGFGVTLTEAGASGLPLVVSRLGGMVDQVKDNVNGILFAPGDLAAQARAMLRLAGDEPLRLRLGEAARGLSMRYDSVGQIRQLEDLLLRLSGHPIPSSTPSGR